MLGQSPLIDGSDLVQAGVSAPAAPVEGSLERAQSGSWTVEELTHHYVDWTLARVAGDKAEAARILGINVSTLYRWLRKRAVR